VATPALSGPPRTLTVMTHDSFAASEDVLKSFEQANNVKLNILKSGDAGAALNKAILAKGNPLADLFYGVDNTFLSRALDADIFEPYVAKDAPAAFLLDKNNRVTPVDYGDVCINYDKAYFAQKKLAVPQTLEDFIKPDTKGRSSSRTLPHHRRAWHFCWQPSRTLARTNTWTIGSSSKPTMSKWTTDGRRRTILTLAARRAKGRGHSS
jgi:spermidine/putrescine-binding protein